MASEETILDLAPVTPAHKFAWRAFKGFVYGSPESPENMGKENARPLQASPQKRVSLEIPALSPQKRKRDSQISPTKSILRTPGMPTPRAKSLRDVNVKFKSISPEILRNASAPASTVVALEREVDNLWQELEQSLEIARSPPTRWASAPARAKKTITLAPAVVLPPPTSGNPERDAYARRTEKEVKQLLRQHKKMRDYARQAEEQNVALKAMVVELKRENAGLKAGLEYKSLFRPDQDERTSYPTHPSRAQTKVSGREQQQAQAKVTERQSQATGSISKTEAFKRSLRGEKFEVLNDKPEMITKAEKTTHLQPGTRIRLDQKLFVEPSEKRKTTVPERDKVSAATGLDQPEPDAPKDARPLKKPSSSSINTTGRTHQLQPTRATTTTATTNATHDLLPKVRSSPSLTVLAAQLEAKSATQRPSRRPNKPTSKQPIQPSNSATKQPSRNAEPSPQFTSDKATQPISPSSNPHRVSTSLPNSPPLRATSSSLTIDRATAARQRLAQKREQRRLGISGNGTTLAFAGLMQGMPGNVRDVERAVEDGVVEESAVDWAGL